MKTEYKKCKDCGHENYIDPACEVPVELYHCDECGTRLFKIERKDSCL